MNNLVTPQEAVKLHKFDTIEGIYITDELQKEFELHTPITDKWSYYCFLSFIWNAGRIHGIRAERMKHRK